MAIKQHTTYDKDYNIKTYTETDNGVEIVYKEFNCKGLITFLKYPNGDYGKWKFDKNGYETYHETNAYERKDAKEFYWIRTKCTPSGMPIHEEDSEGNIKIRKFDRDGAMTFESENGNTTYDKNKIIHRNIN